MENFDILNEIGEITGQIASRDDAHRLGLWHKAMAVFLVNNKKEILLQKRHPSKKLWPNCWDVSIGGHVTAGKTAVETAIIEAKEELNVNLKPSDLTLIGKCSSTQIRPGLIDNMFNEFYAAKSNVKISDISLQESEVIDAKWITKTELKKMIANNYENMTTKIEAWQSLIDYLEKP